MMVGGLLIFTLIAGYIIILTNKPYTDIIKQNWTIELPKAEKVLYSADSGASFQGDGERYHVLQYNSNENIQLTWIETKNKTIESEINKILENLKVSKENMPDFTSNYKYSTREKDFYDKLYLIYLSETNRLYVIENIF